MTTGKRALIVDDSRSARVILSRMLEQHGLAVDTSESAEQAMEYLQQQRPDVIFMDHLMPGMDGFQAVQAIKSDVRTATIPLLMYTSQEGELYVSQARALGAVGVLPKTVRPVDVSRVLYQLHLLPDRRQDRTTLFRRAAVAETRPEEGVPAPGPGGAAGAPLALFAAAAPEALSEMSAGLRQSVQQLVKDQLAEQRRFMLATFEAFARRMSMEIRENVPKQSAPAVVEVAPIEPPRPLWWPVVVTSLLAVIPALVLGLLYWKEVGASRDLARQVSQLHDEVAALARPSPLAAVPAAPERSTVPAGVAEVTGAVAAPGLAQGASPPPQASETTAVEYVPYGDIPFDGPRLAKLQALATSLMSQGFHGRILVEYSVGDFCLTGSPADGFQVADPALPLGRCDIVGNPFDDSLSPAKRQSVDFANFVATLGRRTGGALTVETVNLGRRNPIDYPEQTGSSTAGAWNTVAAQNNRVEIRVVPAG
jgi:CheY-like chemotaxis protein